MESHINFEIEKSDLYCSVSKRFCPSLGTFPAKFLLSTATHVEISSAAIIKMKMMIVLTFKCLHLDLPAASYSYQIMKDQFLYTKDCQEENFLDALNTH